MLLLENYLTYHVIKKMINNAKNNFLFTYALADDVINFRFLPWRHHMRIEEGGV